MDDWRKRMEDEALRRALPYLMSAPTSNAHHRSLNSTGSWSLWYREPKEEPVTILPCRKGKVMRPKSRLTHGQYFVSKDTPLDDRERQLLRTHHRTFPRGTRMVPDLRLRLYFETSYCPWMDLVPRQWPKPKD